MQNFPIEKLKVWFQGARRQLPWRENPTPYRVWISEVMLQQTQAAVVQDYFLKWMKRFPTVHALADASLDEVMKMWEGLGYYSRARHLHAAARFLVENYGGTIPSSKEELSEIKGLGPYTIGAILSFAFHQKIAAVDGNAIRVLARYFAIQDDIQKSSTRRKIHQLAESLLPHVEPWLVVEGLIELGATICKRIPLCINCPLNRECSAYNTGLQRELPKKGKKVEITLLKRRVFIIVHINELLLKKGEEGKVMAGLYEFPYIDQRKKGFPFSFSAKRITPLSAVEHHFTRYKVTLYPSVWKALRKVEVPGYEWISWQQLAHCAFSSGHRKILREFKTRVVRKTSRRA